MVFIIYISCIKFNPADRVYFVSSESSCVLSGCMLRYPPPYTDWPPTPHVHSLEYTSMHFTAVLKFIHSSITFVSQNYILNNEGDCAFESTHKHIK